MIEIKHVDFCYANHQDGALADLSLKIGKGEAVLICGASGSGKTTVTRLLNGLIPHYYEGEMKGEVRVAGLDVVAAELYETALHVGSVFQNPRSQFFCVDTAGEIAFGCENQGLPVDVIRTRVAAAAADLEIKDLLGRSIFKLSGGEKQQVACASVTAVHPDVFVLDEPTSNLDTKAIARLKRTIRDWKDQGKTIVIAEHRLHWLTDLCDRVIYMKDGCVALDLPMDRFLSLSPEQLNQLGLRTLSLEQLQYQGPRFPFGETLTLRDFYYSYSRGGEALAIDALSLPLGAIIAVVGGNGAGKSTFSRCLGGLMKKFRGTVSLGKSTYRSRAMLKKCFMVMQDVNHQLFCESVDDEVRLGMAGGNAGAVEDVLTKLGLASCCQRHPFSLSGGQKQRVAVATALLADKEILLFDEPTSGLDRGHMLETSALLRSLLGCRTVLVISHDPELILNCCTHVLHLEQGRAAAFYELDAENVVRLKAFFTPPEENSDVIAGRAI